MRKRHLLTVGCLLGAALFLHAAEPSPATDGWIQLFNGKNFEGWTPKFKGCPLGENYRDTFRVENGLLRVVYERYSKFEGEFGHLFYKSSFSNYTIRVEYRFVGPQTPGGPSWAYRNSGIMIHCQPPETMEKDQEFPVSIEVQLLGGDGVTPRPTANLCTPGTDVVMDGKLVKQHCTDSKSKTYHGDQWVTVEVEVRGSSSIRHLVEGQTVLSYTEPQLDLTDAYGKKMAERLPKILRAGWIALQAESHPVEFRKVELRPLAD